MPANPPNARPVPPRGRVGDELRQLRRLAAPVAMAQLATMAMGVVDTLMVGRVSVDALAAASIANVWVFSTIMFANGILMSLDPLVSQAHGAGEDERAALLLRRGVALALLLSLPLAGLWLLTEPALLLTGQDPVLASAARKYVWVQLPSIPFFLVYAVQRQYLQAREWVRPAMWIVLVANLWNAAFNWLLIFGNLGFPALGLTGAGIATTLTRVLTFLGLLWLARRLDILPPRWGALDREAWHPSALRAMAAVGLPIAIQTSLEMWAFNASTLIVGHLGAGALAAHTITMQMAAIAFMIPVGIAQGAAVRVGNLIGAGDGARARLAGWLAIAAGGAVMSVSALLFVVAREWLPRMYTPDLQVVATAATILPIAGAFQIFDGTQAAACGVLRGMGETRPAAIANFIGYWIIALPIGGALVLRFDAGLPALWWSLAGGLAIVAVGLVWRIRRRGPESVTRIDAG